MACKDEIVFKKEVRFTADDLKALNEDLKFFADKIEIKLPFLLEMVDVVDFMKSNYENEKLNHNMFVVCGENFKVKSLVSNFMSRWLFKNKNKNESAMEWEVL